MVNTCYTCFEFCCMGTQDRRPVNSSHHEQPLTPVSEILKPRDQDIVTFNVGGVRFETYRATLKNTLHTRLADDDFLQHFYLTDKNEYFFDRDPDIFKATLNFLRTGALHLPSFICGTAAKTDLEFWGVPQHQIEQCCRINYNEWISTQEALKRLERDRKISMLPHVMSRDRMKASCWETWRPFIWRIMNRSNSSLAAKIFGVVSLLFVVLSIFSFTAETTQPFHYYIVTMTTSSNHTQGSQNSSQERLLNNNSTASNVSTVQESTTADTLTVTNSYTEDELSKLDSTVIIISKVSAKHPALQIIDTICLIYFILEYIVRLVCSPKTFKHAISLLAVIDILAILPDLIEFIVYYASEDFRTVVADAVNYITIIRVVRVLRIFRLVRHSVGLWILIYTLRASFSELMLLFWFMGLGVLVCSSLIYYVEDRDNFTSIPHGFWWALITMTTVGYGDMVPHTTLGKVVGSVTSIAGVLMIGVTVPALVNNFMRYYRHVQFAVYVDELTHLPHDEKNEEQVTSQTDLVNMVKKNGIPEHTPFIVEITETSKL